MDNRKIGDVIKELIALKKKYGNVQAVYASDEEGNSYAPVLFNPTPGDYDMQAESFDDAPVDPKDVNAVCIN